MNTKNKLIASSIFLYASLAIGIPLLIQQNSTFGREINSERMLGLISLVGGLVICHLLVKSAASSLRLRVSYYSSIPPLFYPIGYLVAITNLWTYADSEKERSAPVEKSNFFLSALKGEEPLWLVWWCINFPTNAWFYALTFLLKKTATPLWVQYGFSVMACMVAVSVSIMIWRCAPNSEHFFWKWSARLSVAASIFMAFYFNIRLLIAA